MKLSLRCLSAAVFFTAVTLSLPVYAQFTMTSSPTPNVMIGCTATYGITVNPGFQVSITDVQWVWKETDPNPSVWSAPLDTGRTTSQTYIESFIGTYIVQATVKYTDLSNPFNPTQKTSTCNCTITVQPPDGFNMPVPASVNVAIGTFASFTFPLTVGGAANVICGTSGIAKENLTDILASTENPMLFGHLPDIINQGEPNLLYISGPNLIDKKRYTPGADLATFQSYNAGQLLVTHKQQLIIYLADATGASIMCTLPEVFSVTVTKVDNSTVKFLLQ